MGLTGLITVLWVGAMSASPLLPVWLAGFPTPTLCWVGVQSSGEFPACSPGSVSVPLESRSVWWASHLPPAHTGSHFTIPALAPIHFPLFHVALGARTLLACPIPRDFSCLISPGSGEGDPPCWSFTFTLGPALRAWGWQWPPHLCWRREGFSKAPWSLSVAEAPGIFSALENAARCACLMWL